MSPLEALTLPVELGTWGWRTRFDGAACALADRHYSRQSPGSGRLGGPAMTLTFVTPCERAVWLSSWSTCPDDGLRAYRCTLFRNEGAGLSSELIREAMLLTQDIWPPDELGLDPIHGWVTWIEPAKVASANPGYCFKAAGWWLDREWNPARGRRGRVRLRAGLVTA